MGAALVPQPHGFGTDALVAAKNQPLIPVRRLTHSATQPADHVPEGQLRIAQPFKAGLRSGEGQVPKGRLKSCAANSETLSRARLESQLYNRSHHSSRSSKAPPRRMVDDMKNWQASSCGATPASL